MAHEVRGALMPRQEVPYERWFVDHGSERRLEGADILRAAEDADALIPECFLRATYATARTALEFLTCGLLSSCQRRGIGLTGWVQVTMDQWGSFHRMRAASINPNLSKQRAIDGVFRGVRTIGVTGDDFLWGTRYDGDDVPALRGLEVKRSLHADLIALRRRPLAEVAAMAPVDDEAPQHID